MTEDPRLKAFKEAKEKWNFNGLVRCPYCHTYSVAHMTIAGEGEKFICNICRKEEIIGLEDYKKVRRGVIFR